jgi:DNA-binding beta-propeller fold protein YncE
MKLTHFAVGLAAAMASLPAAAAGNFNFSKLWTFNHVTTAGSKTGGGSEIVSFDPTTNNLWVVGTDANRPTVTGLGGIDVLNLSGGLVNAIDTTALGGVNSVAISGGKAGVAFTAPNKTDAGLVRFYDTTSFASIQDVTVGANPDNVVFTADGSKLLVANEAEPNSYNQVTSVDPVGSVGIIDVAGGYGYQSAGFGAFDGQAAALKAAGVRLNGPNASVSQDLEPEYIAISADGTTAYATLQEANSIATVDIATATVTSIKSLGTKDHNLPGNGIDASDRDGSGNNPLNFNIQNWKVEGLYMPDGIASFTQGGNQYLVTANEGDGRDYTGFLDEVRVGAASIDPALNTAMIAAHGADWRTNNDKLNRLTVTTSGDTDGDGDLDRLLSYGARSFSILDANGNLVFDSGDALEQIIKAQYPTLWDDGRSDNKGPEPESAVVGTLAGRQLLFLGLERANAIAVFDLTNLANVTFLDMLFTTGDVGPEGLTFFTAANGQSYVAVANEVSGTTSLYSVAPIPVPAAAWLFGSALVGMASRARRRS